MRVIPPPVTDREISTMMVGTLEKLVGELEAKLSSRLGVMYRECERRKDQVRLANVHAGIEEHRAILRAMDQAEREAHREAA